MNLLNKLKLLLHDDFIEICGFGLFKRRYISHLVLCKLRLSRLLILFLVINMNDIIISYIFFSWIGVMFLDYYWIEDGLRWVIPVL